MGDRKGKAWGDDEEEGHESLAFLNVSQNAQMLKEISYEEHRLLLLDQAKHVLQDSCSCQTQKCSQDPKQCARDAFASDQCSILLFEN